MEKVASILEHSVKNDLQFKKINLDTSKQPEVEVLFEDKVIKASPGDNLAALLLSNNAGYLRITPKEGTKRAPFCMMGTCFECLVEIDGRTKQACMTYIDKKITVKRKTIERSSIVEDSDD